jgi:2-polyprenyl-3-methyl-5-hydroxy-6-metoxy-1,4-benzoquinol methylase
MSHQQRWETEQKFFDDEEYSDLPIPPSTIERYTLSRKPWLAPTFPFYLLGDLRGKYVLEVGCGDGGNAILLALLGAQVVGVDISPKAIEIARHRAELHAVSQNTMFTAKPLELFEPQDGRQFDIVCGWAVLHHVIPVLDATLSALTSIAKPDALFLFSEPVSMWRWLRRLRLMLPIPTHGTPDERPLEPAEIAIFKRYVPNLKARYFNGGMRIANRFFFRGRYEDLSPFARAVYDAIARLDDFCLNRLGLAGFASGIVMYGAVRPPLGPGAGGAAGVE